MTDKGSAGRSGGVWTSSRVAQRKAEEPAASRLASSSASRWATKAGGDSSSAAGPSKPASSSTASRWATPGPSSKSASDAQPPLSPSPAAAHAATPPAAMRRRDDSQRLGVAIDPMSLIASPSRGIQGAESTTLGSSGEQDLTNAATQARYREYVSKRIAAHCERYPQPLEFYVPPTGIDAMDDEQAMLRRQAITSLDEILLLVRKLREGVVASRRGDAAAVEVYHLALFLAVVTLNKGQISAAIHRAVFDLYPSISVASSSSPAWPSVAADFASLRDSQTRHAARNDTHLFVDSKETREHTASLLLLSHTCFDSKSSRGSLEDDFMQLQARVVDALSLDVERDGGLTDHLLLASEVDRLIRQGNVVQLRRLLIGQHRTLPTSVAPGRRLAAPTVYQAMLLSQALPRCRAMAWAQLRKVYMSVPLPKASQEEDARTLAARMGGLALGDAACSRRHAGRVG
ncbi:hypothetical protein BDZ90DRAFT_233991 [Jaminaea rosea]|uniref:Uncharacterized protein n=1 Tax=Jaminaea rosea TaxID=1569628 RepID=A0A316UJT5_9BASI|nr:hypothetical protein BDZ90DRAFT_233991 [Jaminaea rosea]PWN25547.1 hypothetical protein BDZ90DRAFT_233991 [Jaminaea rosea]